MADEGDRFWNDNVNDIAIAWLAHGARGVPRTREDTVLAASTSAASGSAAAHFPPPPPHVAQRTRGRGRNGGGSGSSHNNNAPEKGGKHKAKNDGKAKGNKGKGRRFIMDDKGNPPCFAWNDNNEPCGGSSAACVNGRAHKCTTCRADHPQHQHRN